MRPRFLVSVLIVATLAVWPNGQLRAAEEVYRDERFVIIDEGDHGKTRIAYVRVAVSLAAGVLLMIPLDRYGFSGLRLGAAGLAAGSSIGAWLEYVLLRVSLARRVGAHGPGSRPVVHMVLAAALAAAAGVGLQLALPGAHPIVVAVETLVPFGVVYLVVTALLGEGLRRRSSGVG